MCAAVAKAALNVGIPVEALQELGAHVHIFGQAGTLGLLAGPGAQSIREVMTDGMRFSCGVGLVVPIPVGRIEVNFCHAIRSHKVDRAHDGLQVGFSASF
jgi:outer membrane protein insertion porin family